ncbi:hypothetical protein [Kitasatospora sp. LaBMicrA B282]|uniref:hypothetical protein n=1 Tax=Kitasatospora sp. LaBMicrA B282 TaxID=3420949 RepID=UPI003D0EAE2C
MPPVLVEGAILQCSHGGQVRLAPGAPALTVGDHGVLTAGAEVLAFATAPGVLVPCPAVTPGGTAQPCVTAATLPVGLATKVTVGNQPVLLATANGITASGTGPGTWQIADPGQQILEAI